MATGHHPVPSSSTISGRGERKAGQGKKNYKCRSQKITKFQKKKKCSSLMIQKGIQMHTINAAERKNAAPLIFESSYSS